MQRAPQDDRIGRYRRQQGGVNYITAASYARNNNIIKYLLNSRNHSFSGGPRVCLFLCIAVGEYTLDK